MENQTNQNSYSHILKYTGLLGSVQGLSILVGLIRNKLVALILGPAGLGLISIFNSTVALMSNATNLGVQTSGVKNISEAYETGDEEALRHAIHLVRLWSIVTAVLGVVVCIILSPLLNSFSFKWGNHVLHFVMLSPVVGMLSLVGGELAVLKGTRQLRKLSVISLLNVVAALLTSVPILYIFGQKGIVPSIIVMTLSQLLLTLIYSFKKYPLELTFDKGFFGEGLGMVKLGMAFVAAAIFGSGAEFAIRSYLNTAGNEVTSGLYNAGYMLAVTYGGMIFSAMETDFFPRLSAANKDTDSFCMIVNKQMEVSVMLIAPMVIGLSIVMPWLIPLLFSNAFLPVVSMAQIAIISLFFRALYLPMAYMNLAKGNSLWYLLLESFSAIILVALVEYGFRHDDLRGIGYAILIANILDFIVTFAFCRLKFSFKPSAELKRYIVLQLPLVALSYLLTVRPFSSLALLPSGRGWVGASFALSCLLLMISMWLSVKKLMRKKE